MPAEPDSAVCIVCGTTQATYDVCGKCQRRIDAHLDEISKLHALIEACPSMLLGDRSQSGRPSCDDPNPGDLDVMGLTDTRTGPLFTLASWAGLFREDFDLRMPRRAEPMAPVVRFLRAQLPRIAAHEAADEFAREVRGCLRLYREVVYGPTHRRINLGECPVVLPATDTLSAMACRRTLWADPTANVIRCMACGTEWSFIDWPHLAALIAS